MSERTLRLHLGNDPGEIAGAMDHVACFLAGAGADKTVRFRVSLCLDELLSNVMTHGFGDRPDHTIEVRVSAADGALRLELEDDAAPFNPLDLPPPDLQAGLETRAAGGLGIHLVRQTMDRIAYRRVGGRNLLVIENPLLASPRADA